MYALGGRPAGISGNVSKTRSPWPSRSSNWPLVWKPPKTGVLGRVPGVPLNG
jgi:hypothetical protein